MKTSHLACFIGAIVYLPLFSEKADKNSTSQEMLFLAIMQNDITGISVTIQAWTDMNSYGGDGRPPLFLAKSLDHFESFEHLLRGGSDPNMNVMLNSDPLAYYLLSQSSRRYLQRAIDFGLDVNVQVEGAAGLDLFSGDRMKFPLMNIAVTSGKLGLVHDPLRAGADPSIRDTKGRSLFQADMERGALQIAWLLIDRDLVDLDVEQKMEYWHKQKLR